MEHLNIYIRGVGGRGTKTMKRKLCGRKEQAGKFSSLSWYQMNMPLEERKEQCNHFRC
jgi:hypothetical protein